LGLGTILIAAEYSEGSGDTLEVEDGLRAGGGRNQDATPRPHLGLFAGASAAWRRDLPFARKLTASRWWAAGGSDLLPQLR
jgi:hypothetical protein